MHPWAAITGLLVLVTDATMAVIVVSGVTGHPVTLPCTYSTSGGLVTTTMCWGRGPCPSSQCSDTLIWTDGSHVTSRKSPRYKLKGRIPEGNVSLTIEDTVLTDSGLYCCRIEHRGWFNDQKIVFSVELRPRPFSTPAVPRLTTSAPATLAPSRTVPRPVTSPATPATTRMPGPEPQPSTWQEPSPAPPTSSPSPSCPPDRNGTDVVTQTWNDTWRENQTLTSLAQNPWKVTSRGLYIGLSVTAAVLVTVLLVLVTKKHLLLRRKQQQLSMVTLHSPPMTALQSAAAARVRAEDNIYTVEDNPYVVD